MNLKLIDEDWIDERIKNSIEIYQGDENNNFTKYLRMIKEQLQSPKELITEAFEAGKEWGEVVTLFNNTDSVSRWQMENTPELEDFLKEKGYA